MGAELKPDSIMNNRKLKKINHLLIILASTIFIIVLFQNCDTTEPPQNDEPDTTSQNFTFETFEFGDGFSSSYFNDVWIFDENNIWTVGEIRLTSGLTNILRWDGSKWYPQKPWFTSSGFKGIWALDSANIIFASGAIRKYEEGEFIEFDLGYLGFSNGQAVHKLWGSSETNIWGVGPSGTIVHYNGVEWKKLDFDTDWRFYDVTGDPNSGIAYAVARGSGFVSIIVKLETSPEIIFNAKESNFPFHFATIEMVDDENLYMAGVDIGIFNLNSQEASLVDDLPLGYNISSITSSGNNDIYFFGDDIGEGVYRKKLVHYNGKRFSYFNLPNRDGGIIGGSHSIKNLAISVEFSENKAFLTKIIRN